MNKRFSIVALVLFIFASGIIVGLLLPKPYFLRAVLFGPSESRFEAGPPPGAGPREMSNDRQILSLLKKRMQLSEEQTGPFLDILKQQREQMKHIMDESRKGTRAKIDSLNLSIDEQLKPILDEEQIQIWENFRSRASRRGQRMGGNSSSK